MAKVMHVHPLTGFARSWKQCCMVPSFICYLKKHFTFTVRFLKLRKTRKLLGKFTSSRNGIKCCDCDASCYGIYTCARLDYQPLFGKISPHSSPERALFSGRIKDRTRETAEIEPTLVRVSRKSQTVLYK